MGAELFEKYGDDYYVIGTDFYKTECNLPGKIIRFLLVIAQIYLLKGWV